MRNSNIQFIKLRLQKPEHERTAVIQDKVDDFIKPKLKDLRHEKILNCEEVIKHRK